jgi:3-hydroxybutyryl-CoA dehydrogenase
MGLTQVAVVGCGMMGRGIVEVAAAAGLEVKAVKVTPGDLSGPRSKIEQSLSRRVKRGKMNEHEAKAVLGRIEFVSGLDAIADAEVVVESAVEELDAKVKLLKDIEAAMHPEAVLGTNTSSLRLEKLAEGLARPERFLGLHFFSPVPAMELVELGAIEHTAEYAVQRATDFCKQIGKTAVPIKSSPGYVVNRLLVPYLLHGIETLESGIDIVHAMADTLGRELGGSRYAIPKTLQQLFDAGQLGRKTGIGIYDYSGEAPVLNPAIKL